jgi:uncharacterized membrane protein
MREAFNSWLAVLGIVILAVLIVALERQVRRATNHSSMSHRQARLAANDALRKRLASKFVVHVAERKQELERIRE